ncbi:Autophagy-related protein 13a [Vitis vinifera]|uniref:Autophagy-related protein 13a n=1 Tax=Vitis vinifera TaxID=29760 RepID=A0A438FLU2_VITVI|nr:Autophagy-related protein 13a [Vitis vinifera]
MDLQSHPQPELGRLEQIVSQFLLKSLHIVLDSRIPSLRPARDRSGNVSGISRVRKSDKWFSLQLGDRPAALDNLHFWHRNLMDPMIIDIILVREGSNSSSSMDNVYSTAAVGTSVETVIERWVVQYESPRLMATPTGESSATYKKIYKKLIILLRSLYSTIRLLPGYRVFRLLSSLTQSYDFDIIYKVSSFTEPFSRAEEEVMKHYSFLPVEALSGRLCISVTYHQTLSDFNLEPLTAFPPTIITDYVGSPAADPLKAFPSSEKGIRATSFPLRGRGVRSPSSAPFQRPHSWTSGGHRAAPLHQINLSVGLHRHFACLICHMIFRLNLLIYMVMGTAPVTIPLPLVGRGSRYLSPNSSDPSRHSLPPLSPRSTRHDPSSQESPSGNRSFRKTEGLRIGEYSGTTNNYSGQKVLKDSKDDSGRFSGLLSSSGSPRIGFSRCSSRLSFQDDLDDCDFSGPFDVDDVDTTDSHARFMASPTASSENCFDTACVT